MSYTKAYARAHYVADADLRDALIEAYQSHDEQLEDIAKRLGFDTEATADDILRQIDKLLASDQSEEIVDLERERERDEALAKLQKIEVSDVGDYRRMLLAVELERDEALARLAKVEPLIDCYADTLAIARRFTSLAEGAGVKVRHARPVGGKRAAR